MEDDDQKAGYLACKELKNPRHQIQDERSQESESAVLVLQSNQWHVRSLCHLVAWAYLRLTDGQQTGSNPDGQRRSVPGSRLVERDFRIAPGSRANRQLYRGPNC